jgi:hypothetical protein
MAIDLIGDGGNYFNTRDCVSRSDSKLLILLLSAEDSHDLSLLLVLG